MSFPKDKTIKLSALALVLLAVILFFGLGTLPFNATDTEKVGEAFSSCVVFEQVYCDKGTEFNYLEIQAMGFALSRDVEIYAPFDGIFEASEGGPGFNLRGAVSMEPGEGKDGLIFSFVGQYAPTIESGSQVEKGQLIGRVIGDEIVEDVHNSTIVVVIKGILPEGPQYNDPELLRQFFGYDN